MGVQTVVAAAEVIVLFTDIILTLTCGALHFLRGQDTYGLVFGAVTLALLYLGGAITNCFHFCRHELPRMPQRKGWKKIKPILLIFFPSSFFICWSVLRCRQPDSLTIKCWTSSLRLFHSSTASLMQAVFQGYCVVMLWYESHVPDHNYYLLITTAVFLVLHAIYGVCTYIWINYYDETSTRLPLHYLALIVCTLSLNISGRVAAISIVMWTLGWWWLGVAILAPLILNWAVYTHAAVTAKPSDADSKLYTELCLYISLLPQSFLSAMTVSDNKFLTFLTTAIWLGCFLPQIIWFHDNLVRWMVWVCPTLGQVIALVVMMCKWEVFAIVFQRFKRLAERNAWTRVPARERNKADTSAET